MDQEIDYTTYSIRDLKDVYNSIDSVKYPDRFEAVKLELLKRKDEISEHDAKLAIEKEETEKIQILILGWLQIITSIVFFYPLYLILVSGGGFINVTVFSLLILFNGACGVLLLKNNSVGIYLSLINQSLQIVNFNSGSILFSYTGLGSLGIGFTGEIHARFSLFAPDFRFFTGELGDSWFLIDIVSVFFLLLLFSAIDRNYQKSNQTSLSTATKRGDKT